MTTGPAPDERRVATGLVTLIVASPSRPRGTGAGERGPSGPAPSGPSPTSPGPSGPSGPAPAELPRQWSCSWSAAGPGPGPLSEGCLGEPDLTLTLSPADAELVKQGRLSPSVAFMQGRLKTSGDNALLLRVLAWSATDAFAPALAAWSAPTAAP